MLEFPKGFGTISRVAMTAVYEFILPDVNFGAADSRTIVGTPPREGFVLDKIEFSLSGLVWTLRHLYDHGAELLSAESLHVRAQAGEKIGPFKVHVDCALQVTIDEGRVEEAGATADRICTLLSVPLAQEIRWTMLRRVTTGTPSLIRERAVRVAWTANGERPLPNDGRGRIKKFIETADPIFCADVEWWQETVGWYVESRASSIVQIRGLLSSIILERAANFLFKGQPIPEQIAAGVGKKLDDNEADLISKLDTLFRVELTAAWLSERSKALIGVLKGWNSSRPFKAKVGEAFKRMRLKPPSSDILKPRDSLAHKGEIDLEDHEFATYHREISDAASSLLLAMLGYS